MSVDDVEDALDMVDGEGDGEFTDENDSKQSYDQFKIGLELFVSGGIKIRMCFIVLLTPSDTFATRCHLWQDFLVPSVHFWISLMLASPLGPQNGYIRDRVYAG